MYNTKSPNKKKLRSGVRSTVGGGLGGNTYKTASPYNIKTNNMTNTNGLSPLMQAAVGGETQTIPGQNITKTEEGFSFSPGEGAEPILVQDPNGLLQMTEDGFVMDNDYQVEEGEQQEDGTVGLVITGVKEPQDSPKAGPIPEMPGGVGGPMEMASPYKNYKNPQDYKAFNFGNKPTPFYKYKKGKY